MYSMIHFVRNGDTIRLMWGIGVLAANSPSMGENLHTAVTPRMQLVPPPAEGGLLPVGLSPSNEIDYTMDHIIYSPSLMRHQAGLPGNATVPLGFHQHEWNGSKGCDRCSRLWCTHSECIFRASVEGAGQEIRTQLLRSYNNLRLHIHEHTFGSCETCSLCEDLFYHHTLQLPLLFEVKAGEVGQVWLGLGKNLMSLRKHVEEAHGGV